MRIVKEGINSKNREWRGTCRACMAQAVAVESEMTQITHDQRGGGRFSWEKCPSCGEGGSGAMGGMLFYPSWR